MQKFDNYREKSLLKNIPGHLHEDIAAFLNTHGHKYSVKEIEDWGEWWMHKDTVNSYLERRKRDDLIKIWTEE